MPTKDPEEASPWETDNDEDLRSAECELRWTLMDFATQMLANLRTFCLIIKKDTGDLPCKQKRIYGT